MENFSDRTARFFARHGFETSDTLDRESLVRAFLSEMEKGLLHEPSSLRMIPTYVRLGGKVSDRDAAVVLDAGGTNFRSALVSGRGEIKDRLNRPMPGTRGEVGKTEFYEVFAEEVRRLRGRATVSRIGWCFSYTCEATPDLDARLLEWSKNIRAPSIVGDFVGRELVSRIGKGSVAIVNDTVATLLAGKSKEGTREYGSYIGFILGTGTNAAYVEPSLGGMVVNSESGAFDKIAQSDFDRAADAKNERPGTFVFEKMIAGAYLGNVGLALLQTAGAEGFFSSGTASALNEVSRLETIDLDDFASGRVRGDRENPLAAVFADSGEAATARELVFPVFARAAVLSAAQLAAFAVKSESGRDPARPVAICADGSTYYKTRTVSFPDIVRMELDRLLTSARGIHYEILPQIDDAPMVGAAIVALQKE